MSRKPLWRRYLRFWGPDTEGDIRDEFSFHLEKKNEELIAAGMRPDDARREACPKGVLSDQQASAASRRAIGISRWLVA
jgi:hypothetical protein